MFAQLAARFHPSINGITFTVHTSPLTLTELSPSERHLPPPNPNLFRRGEKRFVFVHRFVRAHLHTTAATDDDYIIGKTDRNGDWVGGFTTPHWRFLLQPCGNNRHREYCCFRFRFETFLSLYTPQGQKLWTQPVTVPFQH